MKNTYESSNSLNKHGFKLINSSNTSKHTHTISRVPTRKSNICRLCDTRKWLPRFSGGVTGWIWRWRWRRIITYHNLSFK